MVARRDRIDRQQSRTSEHKSTSQNDGALTAAIVILPSSSGAGSQLCRRGLDTGHNDRP